MNRKPIHTRTIPAQTRRVRIASSATSMDAPKETNAIPPGMNACVAVIKNDTGMRLTATIFRARGSERAKEMYKPLRSKAMPPATVMTAPTVSAG